MRKRTGDWRDLLSAYGLAVDTKKIFVGFVAVVMTVIVMYVAAVIYAWCDGMHMLPYDGATRDLVAVGRVQATGGLLTYFINGRGMAAVAAFLPLLNPFLGGHLVHFILSVLFYVGLAWVWSGSGGVISRLTALEYARGDLPTLAEAKEMVKAKRMSYFFAPLWPLIGIVLFSVMNALGGLVGSIPIIGRLLLIFPGMPMLIISTIIIVFLVVFSVLGFGMMMPSISVGGKDAFEGWSSSFSYILWGFGRVVCYTLLAGAIGFVAVLVANALVQLLIYAMYETVNIGFVRSLAWIKLEAIPGASSVGVLPYEWSESPFLCVTSGLLVPFFLALRALPVAFLFSYFFSANTVIFLLMRKHVDNVEIDDIYEEMEEEGEEELTPANEAGEGEEKAEQGAAEEAPEAEDRAEEEPKEGESEAEDEAEEPEEEAKEDGQKPAPKKKTTKKSTRKKRS